MSSEFILLVLLSQEECSFLQEFIKTGTSEKGPHTCRGGISDSIEPWNSACVSDGHSPMAGLHSLPAVAVGK